MNNEPYDLRQRTKKFALRVIRLVESLPKTDTGRTLGRQLLRAGTSVGANYRSAARARSPADFIAKMGLVEEEADEVSYRIELLVESGMIKKEKLGPLMREAHELAAICVASAKTARKRRHEKRERRSD